MKKFLSLIVVLAMMLSIMPVALAEEDPVAKLANDTRTYTNLADAFTKEGNPNNTQVLLLKDYTGDLELDIDGQINFYLQGHTFNGQIKIIHGGLNVKGQDATTMEGRGTITNGTNTIYLVDKSSDETVDYVRFSGCDVIATATDGVAIYSDSKTAKIEFSENAKACAEGNITLNYGSFSIYDGTVKGNFTVTNGSLSITGGTFTQDVSSYLPVDRQLKDNNDGTYTVIEKNYSPNEFLEKDGNGDYLIKTAEEFVQFRKYIETGKCNGMVFKLANDIDLKDYVLPGGSDKRFYSTFDGQGYTIRNVTIDGGEATNVGLFNCLGADYPDSPAGIVKNLTIENATVKGGQYTGILVGRSRSNLKEKPAVSNCHIKGTISVTGTSYVGALMGNTVNGVTNCTVDATGTVTGNNAVGGIAGALTSITGDITNNTVKGITIKGATAVGGISGSVQPKELTVSGNKVEDVKINATTSNGAEIFGWVAEGEGYTAPTVENNTVGENTVTIGPEPEPEPDPVKPAKSNVPGVKYEGGNTFKMDTSKVPTDVLVDGVSVPFGVDGKTLYVNIPGGSHWMTVEWGSTTYTFNFVGDGAYSVVPMGLPKTGDMPFWASVLAFFGF